MNILKYFLDYFNPIETPMEALTDSQIRTQITEIISSNKVVNKGELKVLSTEILDRLEYERTNKYTFLLIGLCAGYLIYKKTTSYKKPSNTYFDNIKPSAPPSIEPY